MKRLLFILCLLFAFPAFAEEDVKVLPQFLGRWEPYSHGAGNIVLEIMPNGLIYETLEKTGKVLRIDLYRPITNKNDMSYIAIYKTGIDKPFATFHELSIKKTDVYDIKYKQQRLKVQYGSCHIDIDDFARKSQTELETLMKKGCPGNEPFFDGDFSGAASWVRDLN